MTSTAGVAVPTGEQYLDSLRDGREVWIDGERVADRTTRPAFRNAARSIARLHDEQLGEAPLVVPSSADDLLRQELRPFLDRDYRGSAGDAHDRIKLILDAVSSEFGGRHAWYELNHSGNQDQIRLDTLRFTEIRGVSASQQELVDRCPSDYDLGGWRNPAWLT
jgi:4-hydroxyphenylacetate 3-monooxygenase